MKFERTEAWGFDHAVRGMRNPLESWDKSDSFKCNTDYSDPDCTCRDCEHNADCPPVYMGANIFIGKNDIALMQKLIRAGSEHRKFMRQIFVSVDITAPAYFFAEFDTYKVGVVRNSTSFMHKGMSKCFEITDFEFDDFRYYEVLGIKETEKKDVFYPYETDEFKVYVCENGRRYEVYKNGRVVSCEYDLSDNSGRTKHFERKECKPCMTKSGYYELNLGGRCGEKWLLHRLVAYCWIDNPNNFETVDHLNSDKTNNSVDNLEWISREENIKREMDNGLNRKNNIRANYLNWKKASKITPADKLDILKLYDGGLTQKELAEKYDISQSQISIVVRNDKNTSENQNLFESTWYWEQMLETLNPVRNPQAKPVERW